MAKTTCTNDGISYDVHNLRVRARARFELADGSRLRMEAYGDNKKAAKKHCLKKRGCGHFLGLTKPPTNPNFARAL